MEREKMIALVQAVQRGEEQAATDLYNEFHENLYYHILKTVNDRPLAEDLLQDTFIEIFRTIGQLQEPAAFVTWSKQIAYHRCTAYFKKRREILADEDEDGYSVFDTMEEERTEFIPDEALDQEELKQAIHAMIAELPEEQRSAILLRYFDEISVKEIADIQGVTEGTVKSRLNYGRKAIKQAVEKYEKKNNIKLRCVGVVPLLLWLFRHYAITNGISLTSSTASAGYTAASSAATAAAKGGVKFGTKIAGKFTAKKIIAGIAAAAVVSGGVAAGVVLSQPEEPAPTEWTGYGQVSDGEEDRNRFHVVVGHLGEKKIWGNMHVAYLYAPSGEYGSNFEAHGKKKNGKVTYEITFIDQQPHPEIAVVYDPKAQTLTFDGYYQAELIPVSVEQREQAPIIAENVTWAGYGTVDYFGEHIPDQRVEMHVETMRETLLYGQLQIISGGDLKFTNNSLGEGILIEDSMTSGEEVTFTSTITGEGFLLENGIIRYEAQIASFVEYDARGVATACGGRFWLYYDPATETFTAAEITFVGDVPMEKIN